MGEQTADGYLAQGNPRLALVVLHEAYGLFSPSSNVPEVCDRLAAAGFHSLAPDLYGGAAAGGLDEALMLMKTLRPQDALAAIAAAVAALHRQQSERVAVLGFCMGGAFSFRSALELEDLSAAVVFYGTPRGAFHRLRIPVMGHFALRDAFVPLAAVREAEAQLGAAGKRATFHYYDAEHAFMNDKLPSFSPRTAALAWERTLQFFREISA